MWTNWERHTQLGVYPAGTQCENDVHETSSCRIMCLLGYDLRSICIMTYTDSICCKIGFVMTPLVKSYDISQFSQYGDYLMMVLMAVYVNL